LSEYYLEHLVPQIAEAFEDYIEHAQQKGLLDDPMAPGVFFEEFAMPSNHTRSHKYRFDRYDRGWDKMWDKVESLSQNDRYQNADPTLWTELNELTEHLYQKNQDWFDRADEHIEDLMDSSKLEAFVEDERGDFHQDRQDHFRQMSSKSQELFRWIVANADRNRQGLLHVSYEEVAAEFSPDRANRLIEEGGPLVEQNSIAGDYYIYLHDEGLEL
jgi:hypothetical protein